VQLWWGCDDSGVLQPTGPIAVAVDGDTFVYIADARNNRIQKFTADGAFVAEWACERPAGIAVDAEHQVYVTESSDYGEFSAQIDYQIKKFSSVGSLLASWGSRGSGDGQFVEPSGIAVDRNGVVYVADSRSNRIQRFTRMHLT
jgi:DNA-binding beta-propeller fold protein YncE